MLNLKKKPPPPRKKSDGVGSSGKRVKVGWVVKSSVGDSDVTSM